MKKELVIFRVFWALAYLVFHVLPSVAQTDVSGIINEYSQVTAFSPCNNSVTVGNTTPFAAGDRALIIQMKGATINLTNTAAFGDIIDLGDAGNYEFVEIAAVNGNDIQFTNTLLNSYTVSGLVQLITVPQYTDMTVTGTITCQPWNGTVGGVLVFEASGTVTLNGDIDVKGNGSAALIAFEMFVKAHKCLACLLNC
jgi:hypothetical protein